MLASTAYPKPASTTPQTYAALVTHFTHLLTVAIHSLLSARNLYPATTFLTARAYNLPVRQSRHPGVCEWISSAVAAVRAQLLKCAVARIAFVVYEAEGKGRVLERWVWDVSAWPIVPGSELDTRLVREGETVPANQESESKGGGAAPAKEDPVVAKHLVDMEEQFRALLSRLTHIPARLRPLPPDCTFTLCIELREPDDTPSPAPGTSTGDGPPPPIGHPQPWIPAQPSLQRTVVQRGNTRYGGDVAREVRQGADVGGVRTVPVRSIEAGEMRFEMWVEEAKGKDDIEMESGEKGSRRVDNRKSGSESAGNIQKPSSSSGFGGSSGLSGSNGLSSQFS